MNGKKARKLRKLAQSMSVGSPNIAYDSKQHQRSINGNIINIVMYIGVEYLYLLSDSTYI